MLTNVSATAIMPSYGSGHYVMGTHYHHIVNIIAPGEVLKLVAKARPDVPGRYEARSAMFVAKSTFMLRQHVKVHPLTFCNSVSI